VLLVRRDEAGYTQSMRPTMKVRPALVAGLLAGCSGEPPCDCASVIGGSSLSDAYGFAGERTVVLAERGTRTSFAWPTVALLEPDDGAVCTTAWTDGIFTTEGVTNFVLPAGAGPGVVYPIPPRDPGDLASFAPPTFVIEDSNYAWFGGEWVFEQMDDTGYVVRLEGGETCLVVDALGGEYASCRPDSGVVSFLPRNEDPLPLLIEDDGLRGVPSQYTDPRSGEPLCAVITDR
jgi:hypothetical protein